MIHGCGGVKQGMNHNDLGLLDAWIANIRTQYVEHAIELAALADDNQRWDRLVELNVRRQVRNVAGSAIVHKAWREERRLLHPRLGLRPQDRLFERAGNPRARVR